MTWIPVTGIKQIVKCCELTCCDRTYDVFAEVRKVVEDKKGGIRAVRLKLRVGFGGVIAYSYGTIMLYGRAAEEALKRRKLDFPMIVKIYCRSIPDPRPNGYIECLSEWGAGNEVRIDAVYPRQPPKNPATLYAFWGYEQCDGNPKWQLTVYDWFFDDAEDVAFVRKMTTSGYNRSRLYLLLSRKKPRIRVYMSGNCEGKVFSNVKEELQYRVEDIPVV